jgi:hypothetical protein
MEYKNAKYITDTDIDCEIQHPDFGWIPYSIANNEAEPSAIAINTMLKTSMQINNNVETYSPPTAEALSINIRVERDILLGSIVDPIVSNALRWEEMSNDKQEEWKTYRQALLNIPESSGFPGNVTWPTKPT